MVRTACRREAARSPESRTSTSGARPTRHCIRDGAVRDADARVGSSNTEYVGGSRRRAAWRLNVAASRRRRRPAHSFFSGNSVMSSPACSSSAGRAGGGVAGGRSSGLAGRARSARSSELDGVPAVAVEGEPAQPRAVVPSPRPSRRCNAPSRANTPLNGLAIAPPSSWRSRRAAGRGRRGWDRPGRRAFSGHRGRRGRRPLRRRQCGRWPGRRAAARDDKADRACNGNRREHADGARRQRRGGDGVISDSVAALPRVVDLRQRAQHRPGDRSWRDRRKCRRGWHASRSAATSGKRRSRSRSIACRIVASTPRGLTARARAASPASRSSWPAGDRQNRRP